MTEKHHCGKLYVVHRGDPDFNMANDDWLLKRMIIGAEKSRAILKLYTWSRPAITLGYNQSLKKAIDYNLLDDNTPVIRRITGGRAIYHDPDEITFTFLVDLSLLPLQQRRIRMTNRMVSRAVVSALNRLGIESSWYDNNDRGIRTGSDGRRPACFESISRFEVFVKSGKLAAGAQRIVGSFLIHQGSLKVNGVTACAAIGQEEHGVYAGRRQKNAGIELKGLIAPFESTFGEEFKIIFKKCDFSLIEWEEMEKLMVTFLENRLNRRRIN